VGHAIETKESRADVCPERGVRRCRRSPARTVLRQ
jgi:hypothetical protein